MKISEALKIWGINQLGTTVEALNSHLLSEGKTEHYLDGNSIKVSFEMSGDATCPKGHTDCFEAVPARPVLRVSGRTFQGQKLFAETHITDFTLEALFTGIVKTAGNHVTV